MIIIKISARNTGCRLMGPNDWGDFAPLPSTSHDAETIRINDRMFFEANSPEAQPPRADSPEIVNVSSSSEDELPLARRRLRRKVRRIAPKVSTDEVIIVEEQARNGRAVLPEVECGIPDVLVPIDDFCWPLPRLLPSDDVIVIDSDASFNVQDVFSSIPNIPSPDLGPASVVTSTPNEGRNRFAKSSLGIVSSSTPNIPSPDSGSASVVTSTPNEGRNRFATSSLRTCAVCLDEFSSHRPVVSTFCGHVYCKACMDKVMNTSKKCPACRKSLKRPGYHMLYL